MSLRLLQRDHPSRAFAVVTETHVLVFHHSLSSTGGDTQSYGSSTKNSTPKCMVEFAALKNVDLSNYRTLRSSGIHGTLGLINVNDDNFLCVISGAIRVATIRSPNETVQKILSVEFYCLNRGDYDDELHEDINYYPSDSVTHSGHEYGHGPHIAEAVAEHPCLELKRMLGDGTFYFSGDCDLTNRLQDRTSEESAFDVDSLDEGFLWNSYMIDPLIKFRSRLASHEKESLDSSRILTSAIRGFVSTSTIPSASSPVKEPKSTRPSTLTLISRLSCRRAGTRFNSRGIDDDGNVANFVEIETILWHPSGLCFSYAQIRGSVPLFWEQATGLLPGQQKIQITRSPEATQPAFDKHFESLGVNYGTVHILNLLSESKPGEAELTARYKYHVQHSPSNQVLDLGGASESRLLQSQFDFRAETKGPGGYEAAGMVKRLIQHRADGFAYFLCEGSMQNEKALNQQTAVVLQQEGVFRTNCLDCLDRTNLIQTIISQMALESFLRQRSEQATADLWSRHSILWADNGDALSRIYAGTGALKSSFTRHGKMSLAGAIADARKSATRIYINNFADKGRQNTIDMLLGRLMDQLPVYLYDPVTDYVNAELKRRTNEYSTSSVVQIWVGTFNLNGRGGGVKEDLAAWMWPEPSRSQECPEIFVVGFQEMVELSPQQIMSTDPLRRQGWEDAVRRTLNDNARNKSSEEYILLRSGQLVGAALMVFVKLSVLTKIKNVEGSLKKTGMSGMAGNKGAVAIRLDYANTRLCFVTAHLAAGFANYEERNRDYRTISHGLRFQRNHPIDDHDTIIWLGDFNYRIGLSEGKVRQYIDAADLDTLYQNDQLNLQMVAGQTFPYYSEARITFMPTYKYDNGTDNYDTSEKARIPAWTDRILRKGDNLKQTSYTTAPLRFSDHRPVYATFQCTISDVDEVRKDTLSKEIYARRRFDIGDPTANARVDGSDDEDLIGYDSIAPELPPASSNRRKWWLDNGLPVRSDIRAPNERSILNQKRPPNPFTSTHEPDWVVVSRPSSEESRTNRLVGDEIPTAVMPTGSHKTPLPFIPTQPHIPHAARKSASIQSPLEMSRSRASSHASLVSTASSIARRPAPPIPKKPTLLSRPSERRVYKNAGEFKDRSQGSLNSQPLAEPREEIIDSKASIPPTPPPRTGQLEREHSLARSKLTRPPHDGRLKQQPPSVDGPPLPPRRTNTSSQNSFGLMDDDDDEAASAIPSLLPLRRS